MTKYLVITGGVISGIGKGIAAASIGRLLSPSKKVIPIKCDGYLNTDPGTMNPVEHGEVFVMDDGGEVDMDFGHYERFLNCTTKKSWNLTMGKVFDTVRLKERRGDYLGKTVQYIPHVVNVIKDHFNRIVLEENPDLLLIEIGGTVGDMENELYLEAVRELKKDVGKDNILYVHLGYVPIPSGVNEQKSKPVQQSISLLRQRGIQPDIIIARCKDWLTNKIRERIASWADIDTDCVITGKDTNNVYEVPVNFEKQGIVSLINKKFSWSVIPDPSWNDLVYSMSNPSKELRVAICGKYTELEDSYASVVEALRHSCAHFGVKPVIVWVETTNIEDGKVVVSDALKGIDGVIVPGGFGVRGAEGKIKVINHCRNNNLPYLGLCYGMQLAVIEYARNVCGLIDANSTEINPSTNNPVIDLLPEQRAISDKGGTMRLGGHDVIINDSDSLAGKIFGDSVRLRFRHRYEVNPLYVSELRSNGLVFSGTTPDNKIMQIVEIKNHPFFMATQAHPELTSTLTNPDKFFYNFVKACIGKK
ncbi:MAG: CTP synthase (glutamine hydrolyzing) [Nanoarchaeota archaeon]